MHASQGKGGGADNKVGGGFGQVTMGPGNIAILGTLAILADTYFGFNDQVGGRRAGILFPHEDGASFPPKAGLILHLTNLWYVECSFGDVKRY